MKKDQDSLEGHRKIYENIVKETASGTDVVNRAFPSSVLGSSITCTREAGVESECNRNNINNIDSGRDDTDLLRDNEACLDLEGAKADTGNESGSEDGPVVDDGNDTGISKNSKTSADLEDQSCEEKDGQSDAAITPCKAKVSAKKVRFNLEDRKPSSKQPSSVSEEISTKKPEVMFSDDEGGENERSNIDEDVSQRINRIQNLLRSDRLRTNRKRKYPVV